MNSGRRSGKSSTNDEGFYEGSFVFIKQSIAPETIKPPPNTAFLSIHGNIEPLTIGTTPDDAPPLWLGIHERIKRRGSIERSAVTLMTAFESIITSADRDNRVSDLPRRMQTFQASSGQRCHRTNRSKLERIRRASFHAKYPNCPFPRLLKNNETKRILGALKLELESEIEPSQSPTSRSMFLMKAIQLPTSDARSSPARRKLTWNVSS